MTNAESWQEGFDRGVEIMKRPIIATAIMSFLLGAVLTLKAVEYQRQSALPKAQAAE